MTKDLNGGDRLTLLSEGTDISSAEADLLSAGVRLSEFITEHVGGPLTGLTTAHLALLLSEWIACRDALADVPEERRRFLADAARPNVADEAKPWWKEAVAGAAALFQRTNRGAHGAT